VPYDGERGYFILGFAYGGGSTASMEVAEGMLDPLFETDATVEALDEAHAQAKEYVGAEAKGIQFEALPPLVQAAFCATATPSRHTHQWDDTWVSLPFRYV
jgi:hypothetical protein